MNTVKSENKYTITAKSAEEFKAADDIIKALPEKVLSQIGHINTKHLRGLVIELNPYFIKDKKVCLPHNVSHMVLKKGEGKHIAFCGKYDFEITVDNAEIIYFINPDNSHVKP